MEDNGYITGKIPVTGDGIHKTYEESMLVYSSLTSIVDILRYEYRGLYFKKDICALYWLDDCKFASGGEVEKIKNNPNDYIRVTIINMVQISNRGFILEIINPNDLNKHLIKDEIDKQQGYTRELK